MGVPVLSLEALRNMSRITIQQNPPRRDHTPGCKCGRRTCKHATRTTRSKWADHTDFIMVDGEGQTTYVVDSQGTCERVHLYILLSIGDQSITNVAGLGWGQICTFLYDAFRESPDSAYCGYYLGYDFTQWIKTLPYDRAWMLLSQEGIRKRTHRNGPVPHPVEYDGWQFDILGAKRFKLRPKLCTCTVVTCKCKKAPWMYICDTGPFWQSSFLAAIDPAKWNDPIVTPQEYERIRIGKEHRSTAHLDNAMVEYNTLENAVGSRLCAELDAGFRSLGVILKPSQWIGPGQAAQEWLKGRAPLSTQVKEWIPPWFLEAAQASYYGGWFEIFAHGIIPGKSYEYDINSAYPCDIAGFPCIEHGNYSKGNGRPPYKQGDLLLVRARVWSHKSNERKNKRTDKRYVGSMLHRDGTGRISRPQLTEGWFWWHELQAAIRAHCVVKPRDEQIYEWVRYEPCDCKEPLWEIKNLYERRMQVGKNTPLGKGCRLIANSIYGKFAQSVGTPMFGNPIYASLTTSLCRTRILDAIATHPEGQRAVLMVATDGVYFTSPHPTLPVSSKLGEWEEGVKEDMTLFKPGVYWDNSTRQAIREGKTAQFKARGINAREFAKQLETVDSMFASWDGVPPSEYPWNDTGSRWPEVEFQCGFAMTTALQAVVRNAWDTAGNVKDFIATQCSDPYDKRCNVYYDDATGIYRSEPHFPQWAYNTRHPEQSDYLCQSYPYEKRFGMDDPWSQVYSEAMGMTPDGPVGFLFKTLVTGE